MSNVNKIKINFKNANVALNFLWENNFFVIWQNLKTISHELSSSYDNNFSSVEICKALKTSKFLTKKGKRGSLFYIQKRNAVSRAIQDIEQDLFSDDLLNKMGEKFMSEINDLRLNFNKSGNCTAFLLRKILEKLIYLAFAKNSLLHKLEDKNSPSKLVGLATMINTATSEKISGVPFITSKTAKEIQGIKFLGDVSAHNPLVDVDMKTIIPQMPYIITAYQELSQKL